jgi:hypothetical protein
MAKETVDLGRLRRILEESSGERAIVDFLKAAPWIPYWTLCPTSGHSRFAIFDFPLGSKYKCDLLVINSYSGLWVGYFIEFEPVDDPVFTKKGTPSERLALAQRQVDDWRHFASENAPQIRADMVRLIKTKDRLGYSSRRERPSNFSGDLLADPKSYLRLHFRIVIGRSSRMEAATRSLMGRYASGHEVELLTYDRLLQLAEQRYGEKERDPNWCINRAL